MGKESPGGERRAGGGKVLLLGRSPRSMDPSSL